MFSECFTSRRRRFEPLSPTDRSGAGAALVPVPRRAPGVLAIVLASAVLTSACSREADDSAPVITPRAEDRAESAPPAYPAYEVDHDVTTDATRGPSEASPSRGEVLQQRARDQADETQPATGVSVEEARRDCERLAAPRAAECRRRIEVGLKLEAQRELEGKEPEDSEKDDR